MFTQEQHQATPDVRQRKTLERASPFLLYCLLVYFWFTYCFTQLH